MSYAKSALAKKATPRKTKKLWDQQEKVTIKSAGLLVQARSKTQENPGTVGSDFCADRCNSRATTELCQV